MSILSVKNLCIGYDKKIVKKDINFDVEEKDYICIVGSNGAGKSTLMKTLLGIEKPISGEIKYGENITKKDITYLSQGLNISKDFPASVEEVVYSGFINIRKQKSIAEEKMKKLGIYDYRKKSFNELSGGQKQRALIARALCSNAKILFLDEPVTGLDYNIRSELYDLVDKLNKEGLTIIMITHDIDMVKKYATKVVKIDE